MFSKISLRFLCAIAILTLHFLLYRVVDLYARHADKPTGQYATAALKEDMLFLKSKLESKHPGLNLYSPKSIIDSAFQQIAQQLTEPMGSGYFFYRLCAINSIIKDGHTLILPAEDATPVNAKYLPYQLVILQNRLFVQGVFTGDHQIKTGAEILKINEVNTGDLLDRMLQRQVRDGLQVSYPIWIYNNYFRQYYGFLFGYPDGFTIQFKQDAQTRTAQISALPRDSINSWREKNCPWLSPHTRVHEGLQLSIDHGRQHAILTIRDFHNSVLKKVYQQSFKKTIDAFFEQILTSKIKYLVIDLRNNQGGDIQNGVYLLSWLLTEKFSVVNRYYRVKSGELKNCNGPCLGDHNPKKNAYHGKLYVLINGGSFSNSVIVSACLRAHKRAVFVGQESGGNPEVLTGFAKDYTLPNTGIKIEVPEKQFVMGSKSSNTGRGLLPDHVVEPTITDLISENDVALKYTLNLIDKELKK